MRFLKALLSFLGIRIVRRRVRAPREFLSSYDQSLRALRRSPGEYLIAKEMHYDGGDHPVDYKDRECAFAANHIARIKPGKVLDIGSHRHFVLGMTAHYKVTTIDVRDRPPMADNEIVLCTDATRLDLPDCSFDAIVSLCTVEHFGLGRYGDVFDPDGDKVAMREMARVLRPGGRLIFTTTITRSRPTIMFNAHRIYTHEMIQDLCRGMVCEDEIFFSHATGVCSEGEITAEPYTWDLYCGCWKKP